MLNASSSGEEEATAAEGASHIVMRVIHLLHRGGFVLRVPARQRHIPHHQQAVARQRQRRHAPSVAARQRGGSDHQRQQVERDERIGRTAAVIEQHRQYQHIDAQLQEQFQITHRKIEREPPPGQRIHHGQKCPLRPASASRRNRGSGNDAPGSMSRTAQGWRRSATGSICADANDRSGWRAGMNS